MLEKKPLIWFLILILIFSWPLFLSPLFAPKLGSSLWSLAMWGPGIAAVIATVFVARKGWKEGLKELGLGRFGEFHFYLAAWFLPPLVVVVTVVLTILLRLGQFDSNYTFIHQSLVANGQGAISPQTVVIRQVLLALLLAPFLNTLFALGEEIGWRGFLLPRLLPLGRWPAILLSGAIWGLWHAPAVALGLNFPGYPIIGIPMMIVFCILSGAFLSWLYLETRSSWVAGLAHGSMNAWGGFPFVFLVPGFNLLLGGTVSSILGWAVMAAFVGLLVLAKRLPGSEPKPDTLLEA